MRQQDVYIYRLGFGGNISYADDSPNHISRLSNDDIGKINLDKSLRLLVGYHELHYCCSIFIQTNGLTISHLYIHQLSKSKTQPQPTAHFLNLSINTIRCQHIYLRARRNGFRKLSQFSKWKIAELQK